MKQFFCTLGMIFLTVMIVSAETSVKESQHDSINTSVVLDSATNNRWKLAVNAGLGVANVRMESQQFDKTGIFHYQVGAVLDYMLTNRWFCESGLSLHHKGYQESHQGYNGEDESKTHLYYLQVPLNVNYYVPVEKVWVAPQIGTFFGVALVGKYDYYSYIDGVEKSENINMFDKNEYVSNRKKYRRFDCGIHWAINVHFLQHYCVGLGYDLGLVNLQRKDYLNKKVQTKNGSFAVTFAYYFK